MVTKHIMLVLGLMRSVDRDEQRYWTEDQIKSKPILNLRWALYSFKPFWITVRVLVMLSSFVERSKKCHVDHKECVEGVMNHIIVLDHLVSAQFDILNSWSGWGLSRYSWLLSSLYIVLV